MSADRTNDKIGIILKILFFCVLAFSMIVLIYLTSLVNETPKESAPITFIDHWTVTDSEGNSTEVGRTYKNKKIYTENFVLTSRLPDEIWEDSQLCFMDRSDVKVYIGGKLRKSFRTATDVGIPGDALKDFYITVPLDKADAGAELKIIKYKTQWHPTVISETIITTARGLYEYLYGLYGTSFIMSVILFIASLMVTIVAIIFRIWYRQNIDMLYAALGILDVACWLIAVSQLTPFLTDVYFVDGFMGFIFCMMMPFGLLLYIDSIQDGRYHKLHATLFIVSLISMALWTSLHFAGIQSLQQSLVYIDSILGLAVLCVLATLVLDIRRGYIREYLYTAVGFAGFLIMSIIEIILIMGIRTQTNDLPIILGLFCLLSFVVVQQIIDIRNVRDGLEEEVRNRTRENEQMLIHIVRTLAGTIDAKDTYTNGHSSRVADYSREIARRAGYDDARLTDIYMMGLLHDIGKIGIPDAVINKPGKLTTEEYETIKTHPELGDRILQNIKEKPELAMGAKWHHERFAGGGYPDGIQGEEIPEAARIIAVADAYDAMTSYRSYRKPMDKDRVRRELEQGKGIQFDPHFADIMLQMMEEDTENTMREIQ